MQDKPSPKEGAKVEDSDGRQEALPDAPPSDAPLALGSKLLDLMGEAVRRGLFAEPSLRGLAKRVIELARLPDKEEK